MKLILFFVAVFSTATNGARIGTIDKKTFVANEPFDYTKHTNGETYLEIRNMNGSIGEKTFLNFQNVETMFLFYGRLKEVDFTGFTVMPNLKKLVLNDVKIEGSSLKITNDNLKNMPNLKTLHIFLDEVYVKHIESDVFANTNLEELIIEHIKVHKLIGMHKLKSLGIWFGNTENMDGNIFNEVPNLEDLDLKGNKLPLKQGFFKSLKKLQNLELPNINNGGLKELMWEYLEGLENLKRFDLKVNDVKTITKPSDEMVPLKNMEEIDLSINEIETVDWQFLKVFPNLKILNLASNDITKVKNVTIIPDGHNLRELQLEGNSIKRFSWDFLKNFPHLEILQLHENQLIDIAW